MLDPKVGCVEGEGIVQGHCVPTDLLVLLSQCSPPSTQMWSPSVSGRGWRAQARPAAVRRDILPRSLGKEELSLDAAWPGTLMVVCTRSPELPHSSASQLC